MLARPCQVESHSQRFRWWQCDSTRRPRSRSRSHATTVPHGYWKGQQRVVSPLCAVESGGAVWNWEESCK